MGVLRREKYRFNGRSLEPQKPASPSINNDENILENIKTQCQEDRKRMRGCQKNDVSTKEFKYSTMEELLIGRNFISFSSKQQTIVKSFESAFLIRI